MPHGFLGVGRMGGPICRNLLKHDLAVRVQDPDAANLRRALEAGGEAGAGAAALAAESEVLFCCLPTPDVVEAVLLGADGVAPHAREGLTVVDFSTNGPALARRVAAVLAEKGVDYLDAPVAGGVKGAEAAALTVMVGGAEAAFERVRPLLAHTARRIFHVGPSGAGCVFKLMNNMVRFVNMAAANEAFMIVARAGLDPARFLEVLEQSSGGSAALDRMGRKILKGDFDADFTLDLARKDIGLAMALGEEEAVPLPFVETLRALMDEARGQGLGQEDVCTMVRVLERSLGTEIRAAGGGEA